MPSNYDTTGQLRTSLLDASVVISSPGGLTIQRHNELRALEADLLSMVSVTTLKSSLNYKM